MTVPTTTHLQPAPLAPAAAPDQAAVGARASLALLLALLLMRTVLIFGGDGMVYAGLQLLGPRPHPWATAVLASDIHIAVVADLTTLVVLASVLRRRGTRLRDLIGRVRGRDLPLGLLVLVIMLPVFFVATYLGNLAAYHGAPPTRGLAPQVPLWFAGWTLLVMPVTVALAEELLYRGYLQPQFSARIGRWPALVVVAAGFGLQHAGLSALSVDTVLARVITTFLAGLALGLLRIWLKRLAPLIVAHWLLDALFLGLPMLTLVGH